MRSDRHVVVTGAGTGIGRAIALRLAASGFRASLMARDLGRLERTAALVSELGADAASFECDVRRPEQVERAFASAAGRFGPIDVLVANAGIGGPNAAGESADRFDDLVATNLSGTYRCVREALRHLRPGPEVRHVVVMSSILARIGVAGYSGYCASKAGLLGLVRSLAVELAPDNVQVNALCPGWVDTDMARAGIEGIAKALGVSFERAFAIAMEPVPLKRMSQPEDVAGVVAWLVSDDARGVTGQGIDVNNGAFLH